MPIYEYRCNGCQNEFEIRQKMSDPDLVHCDACGADKLEKLISWTSVRSNSWQAALHKDNPREAMKGMNVVDRSRPPPPKPGPPEPKVAAADPPVAAEPPADSVSGDEEDKEDAP